MGPGLDIDVDVSSKRVSSDAKTEEETLGKDQMLSEVPDGTACEEWISSIPHFSQMVTKEFERERKMIEKNVESLLSVPQRVG